MLDEIKSFLHKVLTTFSQSEIERKAGIQAAVSDEMSAAVALWSWMYADTPPWASKDVQTMNMPALIAAELARLITIEMTSTVSGSARADYLNEQYQMAIDSLRQQVEYACAKGGMVFKPYVDNGRIMVDFIQADSFFPVSFDGSGRMTGAIFVDQLVKGRKTFTRLESHVITPGGYKIKNTAYMSSNKGNLGGQVSLDSVDEWADLQPEVIVQNVDRPLFAYFKMPFANTIDSRSPLGVSVYSRAVDLIKEADKQYSRLLWEFEGSELAIDADYVALAKDAAGGFSLPKLKQRLFRGLNISGGTNGSDFYQIFSPAIRDASLLNGLNALLIRIEDACGLARGTFSDPQGEAKTATELKILKQRSYATVADSQKSLQAALDDLLYAMDIWATLYKLAPAGAYETAYEWDDSIVTDRDREYAEKLGMVTAGIIEKWEFRAWYLGETEDQAKERVPEDESSAFGGA